MGANAGYISLNALFNELSRDHSNTRSVLSSDRSGEIDGKSVATILLFIVSQFFTIFPLAFDIRLPFRHFRKFPVKLDLVSAPLSAVIILLIFGCINGDVVKNGIAGTEGMKPYNILILFFSLAYMAISLDLTGILQAAAFWVSNKGGADGWKLYTYFYLLLLGLSVILGNDPIILSGTAFLVYYTRVANVDPISWLFSEFAAANTASMVLFVGNPTNVVLCEGFSINNVAFTGYTIFPFAVCSVASFGALAYQFRDQIPRKIETSRVLDPRSVLVNPVGAVVGSVMLVSCLIVALGVGLIGVDAYIITLPFAAAKLAFDFGYDYWQVIGRKKLPLEFEMKTISSHDGPEASTSSLVPQSTNSDLEEASEPASSTYSQLTNETTSSSLPQASELANPLFSQQASEPASSTDDDDAPKFASYSVVQDRQHASSSEAIILTSTSSVEHHLEDDHALITADSIEEEQITSSPPKHDTRENQLLENSDSGPKIFKMIARLLRQWNATHEKLKIRFPTFFTALPRLPFTLIPFAFCQFIMVEGLAHTGWIDIFSDWLVSVTGGRMYSMIWIMGLVGVIMCNLAGTNIGATILLTKVMRASTSLSPGTMRAGAIALAVASNIGAASFVYSASLAGLLWRTILTQKGITIPQKHFAYWNLLPIISMTSVGMAMVCIEMAILYP